jgi:hypothetical protein
MEVARNAATADPQAELENILHELEDRPRTAQRLLTTDE